MSFLLDTHAFLWFVLNDPQLSAEASAFIENLDNRILISHKKFDQYAVERKW